MLIQLKLACKALCVIRMKTIKAPTKLCIVYLHYLSKSGSSVGTISKSLKLLCSSVQTIICKYRHDGSLQPSHCSGRRRALRPRAERVLVLSVQINPRTRPNVL